MYFFDSYALVEIVKRNANYEKYKSENPTCTALNLFELHQALLREFNKQTADYWISKFDYILIEITKEDVINASRSYTFSAGLKFNDEDLKGLIGFFF